MRRKRALRCRGCGQMHGRRSVHFPAACIKRREFGKVGAAGLVPISESGGRIAFAARRATTYLTNLRYQYVPYRATLLGLTYGWPASVGPGYWATPEIALLFRYLMSFGSEEEGLGAFERVLADRVELDRELAAMRLAGWWLE